VIFLVTIVPPAEKVRHSSETGNQSGRRPTLSFWNLDSPSKMGAPSFAATPGSPASGLGSLGWSSEGWVYLPTPPAPEDFFREFPRKIACQDPRHPKIPLTHTPSTTSPRKILGILVSSTCYNLTRIRKGERPRESTPWAFLLCFLIYVSKSFICNTLQRQIAYVLITNHLSPDFLFFFRRTDEISTLAGDPP
jgi:hypothetical protein